jgi:hypothetical protein
MRAPGDSNDSPVLTKTLLQSADVAPEYAKLWSTTENDAVIHLDSDDIGFCSSFWDDHDNHRPVNAGDEADNDDLDFNPFQHLCRPLISLKKSIQTSVNKPKFNFVLGVSRKFEVWAASSQIDRAGANNAQ